MRARRRQVRPPPARRCPRTARTDHDGCDDQRTETPERRGEEACPLGIRQLEEIDEGQPDSLEQRIDALIERDAPAWITGLDEVEHEPERPGCEPRRSGSRKRPPARPRLARGHQATRTSQREMTVPFAPMPSARAVAARPSSTRDDPSAKYAQTTSSDATARSLKAVERLEARQR